MISLNPALKNHALQRKTTTTNLLHTYIAFLDSYQNKMNTGTVSKAMLGKLLRWGGAHMGFSKHTDTILKWTIKTGQWKRAHFDMLHVPVDLNLFATEHCDYCLTWLSSFQTLKSSLPYSLHSADSTHLAHQRQSSKRRNSEANTCQTHLLCLMSWLASQGKSAVWGHTYTKLWSRQPLNSIATPSLCPPPPNNQPTTHNKMMKHPQNKRNCSSDSPPNLERKKKKKKERKKRRKNSSCVLKKMGQGHQHWYDSQKSLFYR